MEHIIWLRVFALIGGGIQIFIFILLICQAQKAKLWNVTTGKILKSQLSDFYSDADNTSKAYKVSIKYIYTVGEDSYVSKRLYYGDWIAINYSPYMQALVSQYKVGQEYTVYYNPLNHKKSVLKTGVLLPVYFLLFGALIFIGVGIYLYSI